MSYRRRCDHKGSTILDYVDKRKMFKGALCAIFHYHCYICGHRWVTRVYD